jgi:two-component system chemotaxis family response regulator WspR
MAVRLGGEEMLLLLPGTDTNGARAIAETVRARIEALEIQQGRHRFGITTSVGLATVVPAVDDTPEQLLALADKALYRAKGEGRNRVAVAMR